MATSLSFSHQNFPVVLESVQGINIHSFSNGDNGWFQKEDGKMGQVVEYEYTFDDGDKAQYRTWYQETSLMNQSLGLMVSAKIDHIRGSSQDDHIILICGFDPQGLLSVAQASVQITTDSDKNVIVAPVTVADAGGDPSQIDDVVYQQIHAHDFDNDGRNTIAWLVKANIISIRDSVKLA